MFCVRDHPGILQRVAVHNQDADERSIEGKEHAGLDLRGAGEPAGLRGDRVSGGGIGAEIAEVRVETLRVSKRRDHAVVVAGNRQDRRRIIAIRLVELVVIVLSLAEVVDDVPQQ